MWRVPKRLEGFVRGENHRTAPEPRVRGREAASPWREDSYRRPGDLDPECPWREERAAMRPGAETDRVADDCRKARRDRRNDRHGNASMDCRTTVTWCGSGLALRQPGSSIRTDQTNLAAGRMAAPLRAKTAASAAVTRTTEPFSSPLTHLYHPSHNRVSHHAVIMDGIGEWHYKCAIEDRLHDRLAGPSRSGSDAQGVVNRLLGRFGTGGLAHVQGAPVGTAEGGGDALLAFEDTS